MMSFRVIETVLVVLLLGAVAACSDDEESAAEPAEAPAQAAPLKQQPGAKAEPPAKSAGAETGHEGDGRIPKKHDPDLALPEPPEGMIWVSGSINRSPGGFVPDKEVKDVCVYGRPELPCAESDSAGVYHVAVPKSSKVALLFKGAGLTPTLRVFMTGGEAMNLGNTRVANDSGFTRIAKALGEELRPDRGGIFFAGREGTTATLEPDSGTRFFVDYGNDLVPDAKGVPLRGYGGFLNVEPGETRIRFAHAEGPCRFRTDNNMSGWPDPLDPGVAVVPVVAGHHVHMTTMYCGEENAQGQAATKPKAKPGGKKQPGGGSGAKAVKEDGSKASSGSGPTGKGN
ncbi:MAG: hypothetical protein PVI30_03740 [Myxococcales bacterium]|jgi:hypothetical protein